MEKNRYYVELPGDVWEEGELMRLIKDNQEKRVGGWAWLGFGMGCGANEPAGWAAEGGDQHMCAWCGCPLLGGLT